MRTDPSATANFGATFFAYGNGLYENPVTLTTSTPVLFLRKRANAMSGATATYNAAPMKIHLDDSHRYMVLGVGQGCALFGANGGWSKDCPVLRHVDGCSNPEQTYCRALAIFDVTPTTSRGGGTAKFIGTCAGALSVGMLFSADMAELPKRLD
jgi:hypothetical protein